MLQDVATNNCTRTEKICKLNEIAVYETTELLIHISKQWKEEAWIN
jgi:hypothetical protein